MSDKHFIGLDLTGLEDNGLQRPISRVTLLLDDENAVTAGDDTGFELSADCPHATQAMVNAILDQVKGYQYRMFSADDAALDPAAELGDGVTAGGLYSVISRIADDGSGYSGITAPGEAELEGEFPTGGFLAKEFSRKIAQTRSQIIKTAESITQRIEGAEGSIEATLDLIGGFTVKDSSGTTRIKGSHIDTNSIKANSISADKINLTGSISFTDLDANTRKKVNEAADSAAAAASSASSAASLAASANKTVQGWCYPGTTEINGQMIRAGTVEASVLRGGEVQLLNSDGETVGTFGIVREYIPDEAYFRGSVALKADTVRLEAENTYGRIMLINGSVALFVDPIGISVDGNLYPYFTLQYDLGSNRWKWNDLYLANDPIVTSDRTGKTDIEYCPDRYDAVFDALRPASFRFVKGQSGRTHLGLIAQDVEQALSECGLTDMDFAGFIKSPRKDDDGNILVGEYDYALRYGEFIAMLIAQVQKCKARVATLEGRFANE